MQMIKRVRLVKYKHYERKTQKNHYDDLREKVSPCIGSSVHYPKCREEKKKRAHALMIGYMSYPDCHKNPNCKDIPF